MVVRTKLLKGVCKMSISEYAVEFNRIEAEIFRACCKQGREALKAVLEAWDAKISGKPRAQQIPAQGI